MSNSLNRFRSKLNSKGMTAWLIAVNFMVFLLMWVSTFVGLFVPGDGFSLAQWLAMPGDWHTFLTRPWTLLTYMFSQQEPISFLFNMLWLWWFGQLYTMTLSDRHLLSLYLLSGVVGGLCFLGAASFLGRGAWILGCSAPMVAVMTATAIRSPRFEVPLFILGAVQLRWIALVCIVLIFLGLGGGNAGGEAAHVGGVLTGLAVGISLKRGHDLLKPLNSLLDPSRRPREPKPKRPKQTRRAIKAMKPAATDAERLDALLDKIRLSGFSSLSPQEQNELKVLSKRLNNS